jgi:predicted nucleic acid-binding protein
VATRKFDPPMSRREARELVDAYSQWRLVQVDVPLILAASQLEERHTMSFWDALIVEAPDVPVRPGWLRRTSNPRGGWPAY